MGRGVLLDYHSWAEAQGLSHPAIATTSIPLSNLLKVAESERISFRPGDILLVRSGYMQTVESLSAEDLKTLADKAVPPSIGVESSEELLWWIWECGFVAVAGDMPSFEAWPCQNTKYWMHEWLLAGWGVPIGELFDLERLAMECKKLQKWTFFFSSMPLKVCSIPREKRKLRH